MAILTSSDAARPIVYLPYHLTMGLHGASDAGKTAFASGVRNFAEHPKGAVVPGVIMGDVDGGMLTLAAQGVIVERYPEDPLQRISRLDDLRDFTNYIRDRLAKRPGSLWLASIDTLTRFQESDKLNLMGDTDRSTDGRADFGRMLVHLIRICKSLPDWGLSVIITAHSMPLMDHYLKMERFMPAFEGQFRDKFASYLDIVGFLRVMYSENGDLSGRRLFLTPNRAFMARTRLGTLLPPFIDNPNFPDILDIYREAREAYIKRLRVEHPEYRLVLSQAEMVDLQEAKR